MIEFILTLDYEVYGNGDGALRELVYEPAKKLIALFHKRNARFVVFPEVAELEMIEAGETDQDFDLIKQQLRYLHREGFEIGLHIHPWWYSARRENGKWVLDLSEYNLCTQPKERIEQVIDRSIAYARYLLASPGFIPVSFRAGHLLFQPTRHLARALAERGIKLDSSVYKGGLWHQHKLDYRWALKNEYFWKFSDDASRSDPQGFMIEVPIYTQMAPLWRLLTSKRVGLQQTGASAKQTGKKILNRFSDLARFQYPLKFDLGQMTASEMTRMMGGIIREDERSPSMFRPIVVIAHTKDPIDYAAVDHFLDDLEKKHVLISTLGDVYRKINQLSIKTNG